MAVRNSTHASHESLDFCVHWVCYGSLIIDVRWKPKAKKQHSVRCAVERSVVVRSYLECLSMSRQAFSHFRHSSAHAFMCLSSGNFSHAFPHSAQAVAHDSQMMDENGPPAATTCEAAAQIVAQSRQVIRVFKCSFLPSDSM